LEKDSLNTKKMLGDFDKMLGGVSD